jgi:hypothetical protein
MGSDETPAAAEARRRLEASILAAFNEIAQTYLNAMRDKRVTLEVFASLQKYLDGGVAIHGARCRRRGILLAVHDMKEKTEAPAPLQSAAKDQFMSLKMLPLPELKHCSDVATAILRIEAVARQSASRTPEPEETPPLPVLAANVQTSDYVQRFGAALAAVALSAKAWGAVSCERFAAVSRPLLPMAASLAAQVRNLTLRAPAGHHTISLPST